MHLNRVVTDNRPRPDLCDEFILGDQRTANGSQRAENIETASAERDTCALPVKRSAPYIEAERPEVERRVLTGFDRHVGSLQNISGLNQGLTFIRGSSSTR